MKRLIFSIATLVVFVAVAGSARAGQLTIPNSFTAGTTASAADVNANFAAVEAAVDDNFSKLPIMWANLDPGSGGTSESASAAVQVNSVSISIPTAGYIVISGIVYIFNSGGIDTTYTLIPYLDGSPAFNGTLWLTTRILTGTSPDDRTTMSYTTTWAVTAGSHTVTQYAGPFSGTADFFWNRNNLTVLYYPAAQSTVTKPGLKPNMAPDYLPEDGNPQ